MLGRQLLRVRNNAALVVLTQSMPMAWCAVLIAVFVPLAVRRYAHPAPDAPVNGAVGSGGG